MRKRNKDTKNVLLGFQTKGDTKVNIFIFGFTEQMDYKLAHFQEARTLNTTGTVQSTAKCACRSVLHVEYNVCLTSGVLDYIYIYIYIIMGIFLSLLSQTFALWIAFNFIAHLQ